MQEFDVVAYIDGGFRIDSGVGGWGVCLITGSEVKEFYGGERCCDVNRMELKAATVALENILCPSKVAIYSDSSYVVDGVLSWLPTWQRNWELSKRVPAKNCDLWQIIKRMNERHKVSWIRIKGHSGNLGNSRVDALATQGIDELLNRV